ncbi:MAG: hypothetical protein AAGA48_29050 [Myxococcota bacterium]
MRAFFVTLLGGIMLFGCSREPTVPPVFPDPTETAEDTGEAPEPTFSGSWELVSGIDPFETGIDDLAYLTIAPPNGGGGALTLYGTNLLNGAPDCAQGVYAGLGDRAVQVEFSSGSYYGNDGSFLTVLAFSLDELVIQTANGQATFRPADAVPANAQCGQASFVNRLSVVLPDGMYGNYFATRGRLLFDGTNLLVFNNDALVYPVSPSNGTVDVGIALDAVYDEPYAAEGNVIWARDFRSIAQLNPVPVIADEVVTDEIAPGLDAPLDIACAAHNGTNLILNGRSTLDSTQRLYVIDHVSEPDVLLTNVETGIQYRDLTFHQGNLWGLTTSNGRAQIVQISLTTGQASNTILMPPELGRGNVDGLESTGTSLFVMQRPYGTVELFELALP